MHDKKRFVGLVLLGYLLGVLTALLAFGVMKLLGRGEVAGVGSFGALAGLLLAGGGLGVAVWLIWSQRNAESPSPPRMEPFPAAGDARVFRRAVDDLPTVTDYYRNAADGVLPLTAPVHRDLDPASDPAFAPEEGVEGEREAAASGA